MWHHSKAALVAALAVTYLGLTACDVIFPSESEGQALFRKNCAECHGLNGEGKIPGYRQYEAANLVDSFWKYGGDPSSLEQVILEGSFPTMPAFDHLSNAEIQSLLSYIAELRGEK